MGGSDERAPDVLAVAAALAEARVGGCYWGGRPALPAEPYLLLRGGRPVPNTAASGTLPVVRWLDRAEGSLGSTGTIVVSGDLDPWHLVAGAVAVVPGDDEDLRLIAALAGKPVWNKGREAPEILNSAAVAGLVERRVLADTLYRNPFTGAAENVFAAIAHCAAWRDLIDRNRPLRAAYGFARWKRTTTEALLWNGSEPVAFDLAPTALNPGDNVAVWRSRVGDETLRALETRGVRLVEVEDGFIRSAGLGADCVPPLSIVVDSLGPHFDPRGESELERLLQRGRFSAELLAQSERLRQRIVAAGLGKYDAGTATLERRSDRPHVLVPGQVEDDRAVLASIGPPLTNLELLRRARAAEPDAYLIYKPHPDVEAGHRKGAIRDSMALTLADEIVRDQPMSAMIGLCDRLHVNSSLAGFEALMRGKPVTTHGVPFYAGWGLTDDLGPVPSRRTARRSLLDLIAATLLLYPRYLDPVTGLPCPPEIVVERLANPEQRPATGALVTLRRFQGKIRQQLARLGGAA